MHFVIDMSHSAMGNWFFFKVEGARGKIVRIDLVNASHAGNWSTLWPVCSTHSLDELASSPSDNFGWRFIKTTWNEKDQFSIVHRFEGDVAYVSMKHPLVPTLQTKLMSEYAKNPRARVIEVAKSAGGRPIQMVIVGDEGASALKKPCALIYGREHSNENDPGWVVNGAIQFLLSDTREAEAIREHCVFLCLPLVDPDGAAAGTCENITAKYRDDLKTVETEGMAKWFRKWIDDGHRLDLALNLHNVESREAFAHFFPHLMNPDEVRLHESMALHTAITKFFTDAGFNTRRQPSFRGTMVYRLGGYLERYYGPLHIVYECNSQAPSHKLTIPETEQMGQLLVRSCVQFFGSSDGAKTLALVNRVRERRDILLARYSKLPGAFDDRSVMDRESALLAYPIFEKSQRESASPPERWQAILKLPPLDPKLLDAH